MAEAVAGLLTSAVVDIAKDKLGSAIAEQASLLWNFGGDLEDMKDVLDTISLALEDAETVSLKKKTVQKWLKNLKDAALDISDILQDYQGYTSDQANAKKQGVLSCLPVSYKKIVVANKMKNMREKLSKINMEFQSFGFSMTQPRSISTTAKNYDGRETASIFLPEVIKGRDGHKEEIINQFSANTKNGESKTVIVAIYGLGGMGKTTLAQMIYNDEEFKNYDHRIWVYVSQDFNLNKIGRSIISQLINQIGQQYEDHQNSVLELIQQRVRDLLRGKILIVLDDLWEQNDDNLRYLKHMLLGKKGSMIDVIVTTRNEEIARKVSTREPYNLQALTDDICWEIIKSTSEYERTSNQKEFERIGLDIAKKCGGVPLAANALGYMLKSKDLSEWMKINNNDIWNGASNDHVLPSLMLSYQRMPQHLKICFSYCAIFSRGHNIVEDDLIHQWCSLDLIEQSKGKEYIKQLLGMSFLQFSKLAMTSNEHVVRYTMHDLVHDLARLTIADELIVFNVTPADIDNRSKKYCRYSVLRQYDRATNLANILPSKIRALRFSGSDKLDISSSALSFAKCLRTLDFSECSRILLPASLGRLKQLRCLIAPKMQNKSLPEFITKLPKLQYLNINGSSKLSALPESIGNLGCLKYLGLSGCSSIAKLPESFGDLKCMVHLDMLGCSGMRELPNSLGNLTSLQHLELSDCSSLQAMPESLCGLKHLQYLNMSCCRSLDRLPGAIGSLVDLQCLNISWCPEIRELPESMINLQNLLRLDLSGCSSTLRGVSVLGALTTLRHLDMSSMWVLGSKCKELEVLGNLTSLKDLSLKHCGLYGVDFVGKLTNLEHLDLSTNYTVSSLLESIGNLKRLHTLNLSGCNVKYLPASIGTLGLKSLVLERCSNELMDQASSLVHYSQTLPLFKVRADDVNGCSNLFLLEGAHHVSELRIHYLENVRSLEEAGKAKLQDKHNLSKLTFSWSWGAERLVEDKDLLGQLVPPRGLKQLCLECYSSASFPAWIMDISHHLTNLVSIELSRLRACLNLPPLGQLPNLEKLELFQLFSVKKIGREFCGGKGAFRRLSSFTISHLECLEEWNTIYSAQDGVEEELMFPVLDNLTIEECHRLRLKPCPPTFRECAIRWSNSVLSSLDELDWVNHHHSYSGRATKLDLIVDDEYYFPSLRLFNHFPALQELTIKHNLVSLPESMRHLTSLQSLELFSCERISALPEWLGDLSSLNTLSIYECKGVKALPSCIRQLAKLQKVKNFNNPELRKWCELEENKTNLAHINVEFHGCG